jgi:DNA-binding XRE family transcriptional regulator
MYAFLQKVVYLSANLCRNLQKGVHLSEENLRFLQKDTTTPSAEICRRVAQLLQISAEI